MSSASANYLSCKTFFFIILSYAFRVTSAHFFREFNNKNVKKKMFKNVYEMLILLNSEDQTDFRTVVTKQIDLLFSDALIETSVSNKAKHDGMK